MKTGKPDAVVRAVIEAALAKNAEDVVALDVRETCGFADTFVICHGASTRQVQTIAAAIIEALRAHGRKAHHVEGEAKAEWVLIDCLSLIVHVFHKDRRRFFSLERLWGDAPRLELGEESTGAPLAPAE